MSGQQGQNPYGMGGYGYMQGGGYDQYQQQAYYQQQQQMGYMQQQGYGGQQQQWGGYGGQPQYGGGGFGGPQMTQQQQQQMYAQQQAAQLSGGKPSGGRGGGGGKDFGGRGGGNSSSGGKDFGGRGGSSGGRGGGGGKGDKGDGRMTLEEHKAAEVERKAKKEAERKEKEEAAKRAARERMLAAERGEEPEAAPPPSESISEKVQVLQRGEEPPAKKEPEPKKEAPAAKKEPEPVADDWDDEEEEEPAPVEVKKEEKKEEPAPIPEPVKEPEKKKEPPPEPVKPKKEVEAPPAPAADQEAEEEVVEESSTAKEGEAKDPDPRPHLNVVFIGHVDAGKSTTCGNILFLSGCVDERSVEKYMKEAKDKNRESWFLAYIMDTNEEEKAKGKTVEVGRAHFETPNRRFTILDAPGHKSYVPNMISGASQADVGVLIISARKGEFETGFERGGQTGEHALLAKTLGVEKLVICINKMDDDSVEWAQERYDEIVSKLSVFLEKTAQFKKDQIEYLPISGLKGHNIKERLETPSWFTGKTLLDSLDTTDIPRPSKDASLRIPLLEGYRDMGAIMAIGKVEQGTVRPGMKCIVMPIGAKCTVSLVNINDEPMKFAKTGENVTLKMHGLSEEQLAKGYVLCSIESPVRVVSKFKAMMQVIELPDERPVMTAGYKAVLHCHVASEECEIAKLNEACSMSNMKKKEKNPKFVREKTVLWCTIQLARPTAVDAFTGTAQLGRFTIRDEGRTVAIGKILELPKEK